MSIGGKVRQLQLHLDILEYYILTAYIEKKNKFNLSPFCKKKPSGNYTLGFY